VIPAARLLVTENYPLRTFVTRDDRQADAAKANGFEVL
jgi:hypothetical protein